jgi:hypothetical protein
LKQHLLTSSTTTVAGPAVVQQTFKNSVGRETDGNYKARAWQARLLLPFTSWKQGRLFFGIKGWLNCICWWAGIIPKQRIYAEMSNVHAIACLLLQPEMQSPYASLITLVCALFRVELID